MAVSTAGIDRKQSREARTKRPISISSVHQLSKVQEEERADFARNLHDEISPFLFAVDVDVVAICDLASAMQAADGPRIAARAVAIREATAHMKREVRSLLGRLRPTAAHDLGLGDAIEDPVACARHPQAVIRAEVAPIAADTATETVIHHVVREALSNALQHGQPRNVAIAVSEEAGAVRVGIVDDGCGLSGAVAQPGFTGYGILGERERVEARGDVSRSATEPADAASPWTRSCRPARRTKPPRRRRSRKRWS